MPYLFFCSAYFCNLLSHSMTAKDFFQILFDSVGILKCAKYRIAMHE